MSNIGHNGAPAIPDDIAGDPAQRMPHGATEAARFTWTYYSRLQEHRSFLSAERNEQARVIAEQCDAPLSVVRAGFRFAKMTPEQIQKQAEAQNAVFGLFGYSALGVADASTTDEKLRSALEVDKWIAEQLADCAERLKRLVTAAKERGVDVKVLATVYRLRKAALAHAGSEDGTDTPTDYIDRIDAMGTCVGAWGEASA